MAEHFLSQVSYYRLAGYWWPLQADKVKHVFKPGSRFETVIDLYNFDRELRLIVFNMIERIEIGIRTQLIYQMSIGHGPHWLEDSTLFDDQTLWSQHLNNIKSEIGRSKEVFIQAHLQKYHGDNRIPPAWKSLEVISLGLLSKLYENLRNNLLERKAITTNLQAGNHRFLASWLRSIAVVRNICAHHSRLWNRNLPTPPQLPARLALPWIPVTGVNPHKLYAVICPMQYLLQTISPGNHFTQRILDAFSSYPSVDPTAMGFPTTWQCKFKDFALVKAMMPPTLPEQQAIASILTSADTELSQRRAYLAELQAQKKGLMQRLLTGEVRVKITENRQQK